jgi:hypothetical protein
MVYYQKQGIGLLNNWIYHAIRHHFWLIETFHGIDDGYEPIRTREFINHLNIIKSVEDQMWIATVSDVIKYVDEKNSAKISCDSCDNDRFYQFRVEDNLDDSIFNIPLSISMKIPDNWEGVNVSGAEYKNVILEEGDKFVLFNALPNSKEILIKPENIVTPPEKPDTRFVSIGPSPFKEYINVAFETKKTSNIKVILKNVLGIPVLIEFVVCDLINQVKFNTDQIPNGTYIIELINETNNQRLTRKVIKR